MFCIFNNSHSRILSNDLSVSLNGLYSGLILKGVFICSSSLFTRYKSVMCQPDGKFN